MKKEGFLWDILYPGRCAVCDRVLKRGEYGVCTHCTPLPQKIEGDICMKCGRPVPGEGVICSRCEKGENTFCEGRSSFLYDRYMRRSISFFKYKGRQEYASYYASVLDEMFREKVEAWGAEALVPVPVHAERLRKRGYNQAALIAGELGRKNGLPVYDLLLRNRKTIPQKELSDKERLKNLCNAFSVNKEVWELSKRIKCVIIIDDIYTTGSTIEACSRTIKTLGIQKIYFLCVCTSQ